MKRVYLGLLACALLAAGCGDSSGQACHSDSDCAGQACTRIGQCAPQSSIVTILTHWTINGAAPNPDSTGPCSGIGSLEVDYYEYGSPIVGFAPVPCDIGAFRVDKMPKWLDGVAVTAYDSGKQVLARGKAALPGDKNTDVTIDLVTR